MDFETYKGHLSWQTHPVAVVVPDMEVIPGWAGPRGLPTDMAAFCKDETAKMQVLEDMHRVGKEAQLKGFEMVSCAERCNT